MVIMLIVIIIAQTQYYDFLNVVAHTQSKQIDSMQVITSLMKSLCFTDSSFSASKKNLEFQVEHTLTQVCYPLTS